GTVCVVGKMRDLILQLSKSSIYSTKPPPLFLHDGDVVEVEIEHIGVLHNVVRDAGYTDAAAMLV
ncbi:fumarylacetoacetate hydrolase family protein, partial [Klebsiella pneumoniae]|nr:fumarylacetoacetate hydrolase family protein [Klebsiella pneumoniae]